MTSTSLFNAIIQEIIEYPKYCENEVDIEGIMFPMDACLFLAYSYISKNFIHNKSELYEIFFEYAKKNNIIQQFYEQYIMEYDEEVSIDDYILNIFLHDGNDDIRDSYISENSYNVPYASFFILKKIMIILLD